ncbi:unnamed protein product [Prorocentrum cordatum]|uniref:Uncharacterized protein n=1 Tax=Prorocentrum cordatum TaxID=2364126 RepID=A0ABN9WNY5_9DINO|nr:unnamed protein product [Polarella glacialis]
MRVGDNYWKYQTSVQCKQLCVCDRLWTEQLANADGCCTSTAGLRACGEPDTVHHRLFCCTFPAVFQAREAPASYPEEARCYPASVVHSKGIVSVPPGGIPPVLGAPIAHVLNGDGQLFPDLEPEDVTTVAGAAAKLHLAVDGSSTMPSLSCFQRAAYAVLLVDPQTKATLSVVRGTVLGGFPQTPAMADNFLLAVACQIAGPCTKVYAD